ncbi:hypothetical protein [Streptomyces chartreusis]
MRARAVALRARVPRLHGVIGTLYRTSPDGRPEPVEFDNESARTPLPYRQRRLPPWFLASLLVRELRGVTVVDLDNLVSPLTSSCMVGGDASRGVNWPAVHTRSSVARVTACW